MWWARRLVRIPFGQAPTQRARRDRHRCGVMTLCAAMTRRYYYSPWRAPGAAPVFDSCGMAGGHKPPQGGFGGIYVNTSHAKLGDKGTEVLPKTPPQAKWTAGMTYEVTWTIEA